MSKYKHRKRFTYQGKTYNVYANTLEELGEKKARKIAELKLERSKTFTDVTVRDWTEKCIETYKTGQAEITRKKYVARVEHCILSHIGDMRVKDVTPIHCQQVLNLQRGNSKSQIREVANALKFIFSHAVFNGIIDKDPTIMLNKPKGTYTPRRSLSRFECMAVDEIARTERKYYCFLLMLYCGCRPMEACDCKGSDLYMANDQPILHIRGTKTKNADRNVPIPSYLWSVIKNTPKHEYISVYSNGNKITPENRGRLWRTFWRQMNLWAGTETYRNQLIEPYIIPKDITPYCLRHTYCTDLARRGVDIRIAQKLMGHSEISLTANVYTHVEDEDLINEVATKVATHRYEP